MLYNYFLKTTFQSTTLFIILAVFIQSSSSYTLNLAACQSRFKHIGSIQRTSSSTCANNGMNLIDEKDNIVVLLRSEEHTSELQSRPHLVCRLLLEKKKVMS